MVVELPEQLFAELRVSVCICGEMFFDLLAGERVWLEFPRGIFWSGGVGCKELRRRVFGVFRHSCLS